MKTTLGRTATACIAINRIRKTVKGQEALKIFHIKNVLQEHLRFISEEETRLANEYDGIIKNGMIIIPDDKKRIAFQKAHNELMLMECDVNIEVAEISLEKNSEITLEDIEQLDGFIIFK